MSRRYILILLLALVAVLGAGAFFLQSSFNEASGQRPTLYWGTSGYDVRLVQWKLQTWGYYNGPIDGVFGNTTSQAVKEFQWKNGLPVDGLVGPGTWAALGFWTEPPAAARAQTSSRGFVGFRRDDAYLLAQLIMGEAAGEPYVGKVAAAAVILNRVQSPEFPNTVAGVVYEPDAFESVTNGQIYAQPPTDDALRAADQALAGWDPSYGALFFWNPYKPVSGWIWTRTIITQIGNHVLAR